MDKEHVICDPDVLKDRHTTGNKGPDTEVQSLIDRIDAELQKGVE